MKIVSLNGQMTFDGMKDTLERLPKTNRWVRMGNTLPWTEFEKVYNKCLKNDNVGAANRPGRMVIAALIIKRKHKGVRLIKGVITRMLSLLYRDILMLLNLIGVDDETCGWFNCTQKRTIQAVIDMCHQQKEMLRSGVHTCENRVIFREKEIEIMGRPLGRPSKNPSEEQLRCERIKVALQNEAEAQFGIGKRVYRANSIRAKLSETAQYWTAMCYFGKNKTKFMRELCLVLTEICARMLHFGSKPINQSLKVRLRSCVEHLFLCRGVQT